MPQALPKNATLADAVARAKRLGKTLNLRKDMVRAQVVRILDKWSATPEERAAHLKAYEPKAKNAKPQRPPVKPARPAARPGKPGKRK